MLILYAYYVWATLSQSKKVANSIHSLKQKANLSENVAQINDEGLRLDFECESEALFHRFQISLFGSQS